MTAQTLGGLLATHALHLVLLAPPAVFALVVLLLARRGEPDPDRRSGLPNQPGRPTRPIRTPGATRAGGRATAVPVIAVSSAAAAVVHGVVCPAHYRESLLYGLFFTALAGAQIVYAALVLVRTDRWLLRAGLVTSTAVVLLWVLTRTAGIPLGPAAGEVEALGVLDVLASAAEVVTAIACATALCARTGRPARAAWRPRDWSVAARLALVGSTGALVVVLLTVTPQ